MCYLTDNLHKDAQVDFKFSVGEAVEYTPRGGTVGLFTVVRHMPEESQAIDLKYRIKNQQENFERTVLECDLSASEEQQEDFGAARPLRNMGSIRDHQEIVDYGPDGAEADRGDA